MSSITKLSSASVQPHPLNPPLLSGEGDFESPSLGRRRVGMRLKPKNILQPATFNTASRDEVKTKDNLVVLPFRGSFFEKWQGILHTKIDEIVIV